MRSLVDSGALQHDRAALALRPRRRGRRAADGREGDPRARRPADPGMPRRADRGLGARPQLQPAAARGRRRRRGAPARAAARAAAARPAPAEPPLAAARVPLQARPDPGGRVPDDRRPRAAAPASRGGAVARGPDRARRRRARAARAPLARGRGRGEGRRLPDAGRRQGTPGVRARRGDRPLPRAAAAARAARRVAGGGARAVQARARAAHLDAVRRGERHVPARVRAVGARAPSHRRRWRRCGSRSSFVPNDPDPRSAIAWPNIQLCMQLFDRLVEAWPERTIVPSLAEHVGDRRRRPALRLPAARGPALVGRRRR